MAITSKTRSRRRLTALLPASLLWLGYAHADEAKTAGNKELDTEHIFGFTEGSDIGEKGSKELESTTIGRFGKPGSYSALENETAFRYVIADSFRVSLGSLFDDHEIHDVPALADRSAFNFAGITSEIRWHPIDRTSNSPVGVTFSLTPQWRRIDDISGDPVESYAAPIELLADAAVIPGKLFTAFNLIYEPSVTRQDETWRHNDAMEISVAAAYAFTPDLFLGGEIRHLSRGEQDAFAANALFTGPSVYYKLSETLAIKGTWSFQVPDETTHRLDLVNYERYQALLLLVKSF